MFANEHYQSVQSFYSNIHCSLDLQLSPLTSLSSSPTLFSVNGEGKRKGLKHSYPDCCRPLPHVRTCRLNLALFACICVFILIILFNIDPQSCQVNIESPTKGNKERKLNLPFTIIQKENFCSTSIHQTFLRFTSYL